MSEFRKIVIGIGDGVYEISEKKSSFNIKRILYNAEFGVHIKIQKKEEMEMKKKIIGILLIGLPIAVLFTAIATTVGLGTAIVIFGIIACIVSLFVGIYLLLSH